MTLSKKAISPFRDAQANTKLPLQPNFLKIKDILGIPSKKKKKKYKPHDSTY